MRGEVGHARLAADQAIEDRAAGGIGERHEDGVEHA